MDRLVGSVTTIRGCGTMAASDPNNRRRMQPFRCGRRKLRIPRHESLVFGIFQFAARKDLGTNCTLLETYRGFLLFDGRAEAIIIISLKNFPTKVDSARREAHRGLEINVTLFHLQLTSCRYRDERPRHPRHALRTRN